MKNYDKKTVDSFGNEWNRFDQSFLDEEEALKIFNEYFSIFPWEKINKNSIGFDMGCGTGRWAKYVSERVGHLHCIDPSDALEVAKKKLSNFNNITFLPSFIDNCELKHNSQDFGYSLGVLHHVPDTAKALESCILFLKKDAPFLIYIYYSFDNRGFIFKMIWFISNFFRLYISKLPNLFKNFLTDLIALIIYFPFSIYFLFIKYKV